MRATSTVVVGLGARTPVGLHAASAAAAVRAGVSALADHPFMIDRSGEPMPAALDSLLDPALAGPARLLALAEPALREACSVALASPELRGLRLPLYLALPEIRPGFDERDVRAVRDRFRELDDLGVEIASLHVEARGHAAGLSLLALANQRIARGEHRACLIGGVESYFHPDTMEWLDDNRQLAGLVSRSGFVPGEAAGFCLLMSDEMADRASLEILARVGSACVGTEANLIKTEDLCFGEGLASVVQEAIRSLHPSGQVAQVICDINSERYRGEEWGFVCLRIPDCCDDPTAYWSPADCWGDVGAASGPLFIVLACQAAVRGYAKGQRTLIWASSEGGLRGAAVLEGPRPISSAHTM